MDRYAMVVHLYTVCYNEIDVLPFVVDYWKRFVTHAYVYDNGSDDGSVEFLKQFSWITVEHFDTDGFNDNANIQIKNNAWKKSRGKADFVFVGDIDEMLYARDILGHLERIKSGGYSVAKTSWYDFISELMPQYEEGKLLHETYSKATHNKDGKPCQLFDPSKIEETNYTVGGHTAKPVGNVKVYDDGLYLLHINHRLSLEHYLDKYKKLNERRSELNKRLGYGYHYAFSEEKLKNMFREDLARAVDFNELVSQEHI